MVLLYICIACSLGGSYCNLNQAPLFYPNLGSKQPENMVNLFEFLPGLVKISKQVNCGVFTIYLCNRDCERLVLHINYVLLG